MTPRAWTRRGRPVGGTVALHAAVTIALAVFAAACTPSAVPTAPTATAAAPTTPTGSDAPGSIEPTAPAGDGWRIGVLTSEETSPNQPLDAEAYDGAIRGATAVGAAHPTVVQATSDADAGILLEALVDQDFNVIVVSVGLEAAAAAAAKANPDVWYIGMDHDPCIDAGGVVDPTATDCAGDVATLLPNYIAITYAEDQAGYLAGIVAASVTGVDVVGAVGGVSLCSSCIRFIQGYELGARSIDPAITVKVAWVSDSDFGLGFEDHDAGRAFGQTFIAETAGLDVVFQVAGVTGLGIIDAACEAGIQAIGAEVDQHEAYPASRSCILTSAEKRLSQSVTQSIVAIVEGTAAGGRLRLDAGDDGIGVSPLYDAATRVSPDTQARIDAATAAMQAGTLTTCPADACGSQEALPLGD